MYYWCEKFSEMFDNGNLINIIKINNIGNNKNLCSYNFTAR